MADLRLTFDEDPVVYDRVRPSYPEQLFEDLWEFLGPGDRIRVCEIGAGTGKATASLLARGAEVIAIEIGAGLAAFLRRKFVGDPRLTVLAEPFETVTLSDDGFDVVLAATAWHWLDPEVRLAHAASLLHNTGLLAIVDTNQVASEVDRGYFAASQVVYRKYEDGEPPPVPGPDVVPVAFGELGSTPLFRPPSLFRYRWDQTYARADYQDLMRSYSNMRAMDTADREDLIAELGTLIDGDYGGFVTRPLVVTLAVSRKANAGL